jgi:beta-glucosidase
MQLQPGQTRRVTFRLDRRAFSIWDTGRQAWTSVPGRYGLSIGDSSADRPLTGSVVFGAHR